MSLPLRVAHRGDCIGFRENTVPAFHGAIAAGCDWIELDVRTTADGMSIVVHDPTLDRVWGRPEVVAEVMWSQIAWRRDDGYAIPPLSEVLRELSGTGVGVLIDSTTERDALAAWQVVDQARPDAPVAWCGAAAATRAIRAVDPQAIVQFNYLGGRFDLDAVAALRPQMVNANWNHMTAGLVSTVHRMGMTAWAWTVNDPLTMKWLVDIGIDAITTDRLPLLNDVLSRKAGTRIRR